MVGQLRSFSRRRDTEEKAGVDSQQRCFQQTSESRAGVPLTTNVDRLYPSEAYIVLNGRQSKALADQLTTVSKLRLMNMEGKLSNADISKVEQAVRTQLEL